MPKLLHTELIGWLGLCLIVSSVILLIAHLTRPGMKALRLWIAPQLALAAVLSWISRPKPAEFPNVKLDQTSIQATFKSISIEGSERQLVFHYVLANVSDRAFLIDTRACSTVSFRFLESNRARPVLTGQVNPGLSLLENNGTAYSKLTGLQRLSTTSPALSLERCPMELQPKQSQEVSIAIPYAYPASESAHPSADDLKNYVRAFMPRMDGFGLSGLGQSYEIVFPRP